MQVLPVNAEETASVSFRQYVWLIPDEASPAVIVTTTGVLPHRLAGRLGEAVTIGRSLSMVRRKRVIQALLFPALSMADARR